MTYLYNFITFSQELRNEFVKYIFFGTDEMKEYLESMRDVLTYAQMLKEYNVKDTLYVKLNGEWVLVKSLDSLLDSLGESIKEYEYKLEKKKKIRYGKELTYNEIIKYITGYGADITIQDYDDDYGWRSISNNKQLWDFLGKNKFRIIPNRHQTYYTVEKFDYFYMKFNYYWFDEKKDYERLSKGLVFVTEEEAKYAAMAMTRLLYING